MCRMLPKSIIAAELCAFFFVCLVNVCVVSVFRKSYLRKAVHIYLG